MKKIINRLIPVLAILLTWSCIETFELNEVPPTAEDAVFVFEPSAENDNIINFEAQSSAFMLKWDLGNGSTVTGKSVTGTYPLAGTYTVTFDGEMLPNGVYYCRFQNGVTQQVRTMLKVR